MRSRVSHGAIFVAIFLALGSGSTRAQDSGSKPTLIKIKDVKPIYPPKSLLAGDEGVVLVELKVGASGTVAEARVIWSKCPALNAAALMAARAWEFEPVRINGRATESLVTAPVEFRLPERFKSRAGRSGACKWIDPPRPTH